jgi:5-methylcytosine-specific restriction protein B
MDRFTWGDLLAYIEKSGVKPALPGVVVDKRSPYVLIIDEINRGNISRIFGELITLIEPSKRAGAAEGLSVTLPYSKKPFSVPSNVYLIGTMNTADRSLAGLDIALRRRFTFKEMPPKPELLDGISVNSVDIGRVLLKMNERIEVLLDRDHCLGHAYFMPLIEDRTLENLAFIFRQQILPLLQEYFFEDWERIAWVLNDQVKSNDHAFVQKIAINLDSLFGAGTANELQNEDKRWRINEKAFGSIESYEGILGVAA